MRHDGGRAAVLRRTRYPRSHEHAGIAVVCGEHRQRHARRAHSLPVLQGTRTRLRDNGRRRRHEAQLAGAVRDDFGGARRRRGLASLEPLSSRRTRPFASRADVDGRRRAPRRRRRGGGAFAGEAACIAG